MKKILITGITGFAGSFLAEELLQDPNNRVFGTCFSKDGLDSLPLIKSKTENVVLNLLDFDKTKDTVSEIKPDVVFHLAALTSPAESFENPSEVMVNNIKAEISILEAIRKTNLKDAKILITSSAEIYGIVDSSDLPIDEETPLRPTSPYAVSKIAQDYLGLQYYLSYKFNIIRVRPFNHIGPRQTPYFVVPAFAKKIAEIEKNLHEPILSVGNLESKRDFTDVRDMVKAYILLVEKGKVGDVYNVGSGTSYKISEILKKLLSYSNKKIEVKQDEALLRPSDNPDLCCDNSKINKVTGWEPKIPIETSLKDVLDYWRGVV